MAEPGECLTLVTVEATQVQAAKAGRVAARGKVA
jgi:hypothetical protein